MLAALCHNEASLSVKKQLFVTMRHLLVLAALCHNEASRSVKKQLFVTMRHLLVLRSSSLSQ